MTRAVVMIGFLIAFAAGLGVGVRVLGEGAAPAARPARHGGWLAAELNLTPQQQEQMHLIWSDTASRGGRDRDESRRRLFRQRDEAIAKLIRPEDKARYDEILRDHAERVRSLEEQWRTSFQTAVDRTREILTPEQRARYEEMLRHHQRERGPHERHRGELPTGSRGARR